MAFKKLTQEEFINKAKLTHGDKYDYSLVKYVNNRTKIKIICRIHGAFNQTASSHKRGCCCPKCKNTEKGLSSVLPKNLVIEKFKKVHGDKYDYSFIEYINSFTKIKIICPTHGLFLQTPSSHSTGKGCSKCVKHKNFTQNIAIEQFHKKHNNKYDYSLVEYKLNNDKIKIICPIENHGIFEMTSNAHFSGRGCPKCGKNYRFKTNEIIDEFKHIHGNRYDYSLVEYKNAHTKIKIICQKHGEFEQEPNSHKCGVGCPSCLSSKGESEIRKTLNLNNIKFIPQFKFNNCKRINKLSFDFYIPSKNMLIEFNGIQHYKALEFFGGDKSFKLTQIRDAIKNEYCKNNNITLIIIKYDESIEKVLKNNKVI